MIEAKELYIDSAGALYDLRLESPATYQKVLELREEHDCLMHLPIDRIVNLQKRAVETLIEDGIVKRRYTPEEIDLKVAERNNKKVLTNLTQ